jgi:predicted MFS family arabinose efflux permease
MVLGGLLADWNWRALFWGDGLTTLAFGLVVYASIADTRPAIHASAAPTAGSTSPWRDAVFLQILAASLAFSIAFFADFTILPLTITQSAGYPSRVYGFLIAVNGLLVGALEMSAAARLRRYRRLRVSALGVALAGMGLAATGLVMHWSWFLVAILVWTAGEILALPQQLAFVADWAPPVSRGAYLGLYGATWSLGFALNPLVFLPLHRRLPESLFWLLLGLLNVIPCWISLRLDARADHPEKLRGASREGEPPPQGVPPSDVVMEG